MSTDTHANRTDVHNTDNGRNQTHPHHKTHESGTTVAHHNAVTNKHGIHDKVTKNTNENMKEEKRCDPTEAISVEMERPHNPTPNAHRHPWHRNESNEPHDKHGDGHTNDMHKHSVHPHAKLDRDKHVKHGPKETVGDNHVQRPHAADVHRDHGRHKPDHLSTHEEQTKQDRNTNAGKKHVKQTETAQKGHTTHDKVATGQHGNVEEHALSDKHEIKTTGHDKLQHSQRDSTHEKHGPHFDEQYSQQKQQDKLHHENRHLGHVDDNPKQETHAHNTIADHPAPKTSVVTDHASLVHGTHAKLHNREHVSKNMPDTVDNNSGHAHKKASHKKEHETQDRLGQVKHDHHMPHGAVGKQAVHQISHNNQHAGPHDEFSERPHVSREDTQLDIPTSSNQHHDDPGHKVHNAHDQVHATHLTHDQHIHQHHHHIETSERNIKVTDWATANQAPTPRRHVPVSDMPTTTHEHHWTKDTESPVHAGHTLEHETDEKPYALKTCYMHVEKGAEKKECWITGCAVLSPDRVVVSDYNNNRVKIISVETSETYSRIVLPTSPKDITIVNAGSLAVTLPAMDTVQFLSMDGHLPILDMAGSFKVKGYCNGIDYHNEELFVSFISPPKVEIITLYGEVLATFDKDYNGRPLFKTPQYLVSFHNAIFVSDSHNNAVVKLSRTGDVLGTYNDVELHNPQGLVVTPNGQILVCGQDSHNVHLISTDCRTVSVFLDKKDGIWWPHVIGLCKGSNNIYISSTSGEPEFDNYMRLYSFSDIRPLSVRLMKIHGH